MGVTAEQVREAVESNSWAETSSIREFNDSSWQAIADELNAAIDGGECERVKRGTKPDGTPRWRCSKCDYGIGDSRWAYCPKCGARIRKAVKR